MRSFAKLTQAGLVALVGLTGLASPTSDLLAVRSDRSVPVEMGVWHADLNKAKAYAEAKGMPLIAVWSNGETCSHCLVFESMAMAPVFQEWMKTSGCVFYYGVSNDGPNGPTADGQEGYHGTSFYWCRKKEGSYDPNASKNWPYVRIYWCTTGGIPKVDMFETGAALDGEYDAIPMPAPKNCTGNPKKFVVKGDDGTFNPSARYFINKMTNGVNGVLRSYALDPLVVSADKPNGCYRNGQDVVLSCLQEGATIYYTTDGMTPTTGSMVYEAPIKFVPPSMTIKAFAVADEGKTGNVYTIECRLPQLEVEMMFRKTGICHEDRFVPTTADYIVPEGSAVEVTMRLIPAYDIHYTLDGSEPTGDSPIYEWPLLLAVTNDVRVSAKAFGDGENFGDSDVVSYAIRRCVKTPEIAVEKIGEGLFQPCRVSVSCATEGATIFRRQAYEVWMGVEWQDEIYEGPFTVDHPLDLYFFARKDGLEDSDVVCVSACDWPSSYEDSNLVKWNLQWDGEEELIITGVDAYLRLDPNVLFPSEAYGEVVGRVAEGSLRWIDTEVSISSITFTGAPPVGLAASGISDRIQVRYDFQYQDQWAPMLAEWGFSNVEVYGIPEEPPPVSVVTNYVCVTVTNVVVHYVQTSQQPQFALPPTSDVGFVNIITEVKSGGVAAIPETWTQNYPDFVGKFGSDFTAALGKPTGKVGADGVPMLVWQDYVAGTDPTNEKDVFIASVTVVDGKVTISYSPELDDARKAMRKYTTWGKKSLMDVTWSEVPEGCEADYNFFKVSVEMR